jgi:hypothetical protein
VNLTVRLVVVAPTWVTPVKCLLFLGLHSLIIIFSFILAVLARTKSKYPESGTDTSVAVVVCPPMLVITTVLEVSVVYL